PLAYRFDRIMTNRFYDILDNTYVHYCLSRRTDTAFRQEIGKPRRMTDRLRAKLDCWRDKPPSTADVTDPHFPGQPSTPLPSGSLPGDHRPPTDAGKLFTRSSYAAVLDGMDFLREECEQFYGRERPPTTMHRHVAERLALAPQKLPPHDLWLQRIAGMKAYPKR